MSDIDVTLQIKADLQDALRRIDAIERGINDLSPASRKAAASLRASASAMNSAGKEATDATSEVDRLADAYGKLRAAVAVALGAGAAVNVAVTADEIKLLKERVAGIAGEMKDWQSTWQKLYALSQDNGVAVESTVEMYQRLSIAAERLGASEDDVLKVVRAVQQLGRQGGATAQQIADASVQFGQMLGQAKAQADEYNSIADAMPLLVREIEKGLGAEAGTLKQLIAAELETSKIFDAVLKRSDAVNEKAKTTSTALVQGWTQLTNAAANFTAAADESLGITQEIAETFKFAGEWVDYLAARWRKAFVPAALGIDPRITGQDKLNALLDRQKNLIESIAEEEKNLRAKQARAAMLPGKSREYELAKAQLAQWHAELTAVEAELKRLRDAQAAAGQAAASMAESGEAAARKIAMAAYDGADGIAKLRAEAAEAQKALEKMDTAVNGPKPEATWSDKVRQIIGLAEEASAAMTTGDLAAAIPRIKEGADLIAKFVTASGGADITIRSLAERFDRLGKAASSAAKQGKTAVDAAAAAQKAEITVTPKLDDAALAALSAEIAATRQTIYVDVVPRIVGTGYPGGGTPSMPPGSSLEWANAQSGATDAQEP